MNIDYFYDNDNAFINSKQLSPASAHSGEIVSEHLERLLKAADRAMDPLMLRAGGGRRVINASVSSVLDKALECHPDLGEGLVKIVSSSLTSPSQQCRNLSDIGLYLSLLSRRAEQDEGISQEDYQLLHDLAGEIQEVTQQFFQALTPVWTSHLDKIDGIIRDELPKVSPLPPVVSVLNTQKGTPLDDKTFAHIQAEAVIQKSGLEGHAEEPVLTYLGDFLKTYEASYLTGDQEGAEITKELPALIKMIDEARNLARAAKSNQHINTKRFEEDFSQRLLNFETLLSTTVEDLKPGEKTLVPVGWTGTKSGHSMKLGIERDEEGKLDVVLYNTGSGLDSFHASLRNGNATYYQTFIRAENVSPQRLLDPLFVRALLELNVCPRDPVDQCDTKYSAKDIYALFQQGLDAKVITCEGVRDKFDLPRTAGICTWSSLLAVFHRVLSPKDYHKLNSDITFDGLCTYFQSVKSEIPVNEEKRLLLRHAAVRCGQVTLDAYSNGAISLERLQVIQATLRELEQVLETVEGKVTSEATGALMELHFQCVESPVPHGAIIRPWELVDLTNESVSPDFSVPAGLPLVTFNLDWVNDQVQITDGLLRLEEHVRSCFEAKDSRSGIENLNQFFSCLAQPNAEDLWRKIPLQQKTQTMVHLADLSELLFDAYLAQPSSNRTFTTYAHYANALMIVLGEDHPDVDLFYKYVNRVFYLNKTRSSSHFGSLLDDQNLYSSNERLLQNKALNIFYRDSVKDRLNLIKFDQKEYRIPSRSINAYQYCDLEYIQILLERNPEIEEKLRGRYPRFESELALPDWKVALALADWQGEILPPEFCAARRQALIASSLLEGKALDSKKGETFRSEIIKRHDGGPSLVFTSPPTERPLPFRDFKSDRLFDEVCQIRKRQNQVIRQNGASFFNFESEADVMLKPLNEWERSLELILTQGDRNAEEQYLEQQVTKTVAYFSEHLAELADHDTRMLCRLLIFECDYIETLLRLNPALGNVLSQFVNSGLEYYLASDDVEGAMFFVEMGRTLDTIASSRDVKMKLPDFRLLLLDLLKVERSAEERTLLYQQVVASYVSHPPQDLNSTDITRLIIGMLHGRIFPHGDAKETDHLLEEMKRSQMIWHKQISTMMQSGAGAQICNAIVGAFDPFAGKKQWDLSQYPQCRSTDGVYILDVDSLQLLENRQSLSGLPVAILEDKNFQHYFSKKNYACHVLNDGQYEFTDQRGILTRAGPITDRDRSMVIRQQFEGHWYELTNLLRLEVATPYVALLPKDFRGLCDQSSVWISIEKGVEPHVLLKNSQHDTTHRVDLKEVSPKLTEEERQRFYQFLVDTDVRSAPIRQKILSEDKGFLNQYLELDGNDAKKLAERIGLAKSPPSRSKIVNFFSKPSPAINTPPLEGPALFEFMDSCPESFELSLCHRILQLRSLHDKLEVDTCCKQIDAKTSWRLVDLKNAPETTLKHLFGEGMLWRDGNDNLTELELPSLGVTFKMVREASGDWRADSVEYPGYRLASNQHYRGLAAVNGAVVLENRFGKRKLVLPYGEVRNQKPGSLNSTITIKVSSDPTNRSIAIDLDASSRPAASNREQQLYLANVLLGQKKYHQAQALLRASYSPIIPYTNEELDRLEAISRHLSLSKDQSPHAIAVALTAMALIGSGPDPRSPIDASQRDQVQEALEQLTQNFRDYWQQTGRVPDLQLSDEEAINFLHGLLRTMNKYAKGTDKTDIQSAIESWIETLEDSAKEAKLPPLDHARSTMGNITVQELKRVLNSGNKPKSALITRPGAHFKAQFLELYQTAFDDSVKLEILLAGAENDPRVPFELVGLLRAVSRAKAEPTENAEAFDRLLAEANRVNASWDEKQQETVELTNSLPTHYRRDREAQIIGVVSNPIAALAIQPLPNRPPILTSVQLGEAFITVDNGGLHLSEQEIQQLQTAIGSDTPSANAAELGANIKSYWSLPEHQADWHKLDNSTLIDMSTNRMVDRSEKTKTLLQVTSAEMGKRVGLLEQELLSLANQLPVEVLDAVLFETEKSAHMRQEVTLHDLIVFTARSQHFTLTNKNPSLAAIEQRLLQHCLVYLDARAQQQQVKRAIGHFNTLEGLDESDDAYGRVSEQLYQELTREVPYKVHENPEMLVFEVMEDIGLRAAQVADLKRMLNPKPGENPNIILEKVMGSGKTKVYLPLLALNKADGDHLSVIVVHASQYEGVTKAMQVSSGQTFAQVAHPLHFSRDSDTSVSGLRKILKECEQVRQKRHFFVVTDKAMHSLQLASDQLWDAYLKGEGDDADLAARITLMREILSLFKNKGRATFDEADLLLNCRFEVVYSLGDERPIDPIHRDIVADLYQAITPKVAKIVPFTKAEYERLKPELIEAFIKNLVDEQPSKLDDRMLASYFQGEKEGADYVDSLSDQLRRQLAIVRYEFSELLPVVLEKRCGEHFGYSQRPDQILAVPFVASGIPSLTSEFSFPYALMDYTIQTLQSEGVTQSLLKSLITNMQSSAAKEMAEDRSLLLQQTDGFKKFQELLGDRVSLPFLKINDADFAALAKIYREDPPDLYAFAKKFLLPAVTIHDRKLTSTPYTLVNMFFETQGFTGTPWNSATYAKTLQTLRDLYSAGKTQGIIWKNSQTVHSLPSSNLKETIDEIAKIHAKGDYGAFIDVGALFNGIDNQQVAQELLKTLPHHIKGVLFYQNNKPVVLNRAGVIMPYEKVGKTDDLYIFYDQWHTTGTDFKIAGKSLLSIDKNTKMRDLEQGYMRDRQAESAPRVEFILSGQARDYITKELQVPENSAVGTAEILRCMQLNQERELETQMVMATFGMIKEATVHYLRSLLNDSTIPPEKIKNKADIIYQFIGEQVKEDPYEQFGRYQESISSQDFFKTIVDQAVVHFKPILQDNELCPKGLTEVSLRQELEACVNLALLPETMTADADNSPDQLVEHQNQQEQQNQNEVQQQQMSQVQKELIGDLEGANRKGAIHWNWMSYQPTYSAKFFRTMSLQELKNEELPSIDWVWYGRPKADSQAPFLSIAEVFAAEPGLNEFADIFDIEASYNFLPVEGHRREGTNIVNVHNTPFEKQQLRSQQVLICKDLLTGKTQVSLISQADTGFFCDQLSKDRQKNDKREVDVTVYHYTLKVLQSNDKVIAGEVKDVITPDVRQKIVQAKFFNGEISYSKEEQKYLKAWITDKGAGRMRRLFEEHILKYKKDKSEDYHNSLLQRLLAA